VGHHLERRLAPEEGFHRGGSFPSEDALLEERL